MKLHRFTLIFQKSRTSQLSGAGFKCIYSLFFIYFYLKVENQVLHLKASSCITQRQDSASTLKQEH